MTKRSKLEEAQKQILDPKKDLPFKRLFGTPENRDILLSLINAVLQYEEEIVAVEILNPYNVSKYDAGKDSALDLKVVDEKGRLFAIEMQSYEDPFFFQRALYYWAKVFSDQLGKAQKYGELRRTIGIHILNFNHLKEMDNYRNRFQILNIDEKEKTFYGMDFLQLYFIELTKFPKSKNKENDALKDWLNLFCNPDKALQNTDKIKTGEVREAIEKLGTMKLTGEEKELFLAREKWEIEHGNMLAQMKERGRKMGVEEGIKKGREEGIATGQRQAAIKLAKSLKEDGMSPEKIASLTSLTKDEIEKL